MKEQTAEDPEDLSPEGSDVPNFKAMVFQMGDG